MPDPTKLRAEYERQKALYDQYNRERDEYYKRMLGAEEPTAAPEAERPGLLSRFLNRAEVSTERLGANIGKLAGAGMEALNPGLVGYGAQSELAAERLRKHAAEKEAQVPEAQGLLESAASAAGYMAPDIAATMLGSSALEGLAEAPGMVGRAAKFLSGGEKAKGALGLLRRSAGGAVASAPALTIPRAVAGEQEESPTGMLTGTTNPLYKVAGDIGFDVLGGAAGEALSPLARALFRGSAGKKAVEEAAVKEAQRPMLMLPGPGQTSRASWPAVDMPTGALRIAESGEVLGPGIAGKQPSSEVFPARPVRRAASPATREDVAAYRASQAKQLEGATPEEVAAYNAQEPTNVVAALDKAMEQDLAKRDKLVRASNNNTVKMLDRKLQEAIDKNADQATLDKLNDKLWRSLAEDNTEAAIAYNDMQIKKDLAKRGMYTSMFGGGQLGEALGTQAGRDLATKVALGTTGYAMSDAEDERIAATGRGMMGLAALSMAYPTIISRGGSAATALKEQLSKSPTGVKALNFISRDILADPQVKAIVKAAEEEMAKWKAKGLDLARAASGFGKEGERQISDLVEKEKFAGPISRDPESMAAMTAVAKRVADEVAGLGREQVKAGTLSQQAFAKREGEYLPRIYGLFKAGDATAEKINVTKGGRRFEIAAQRIRDDLLTPEERNALGEIREAPQRIAEAFNVGGRNIASANMYKALEKIPGVIHPEYQAAVNEMMTAKALADAARATGDKLNAADAMKAFRDAQIRMEGIAQQVTRSGGEYVRLPDTQALGVMRGAVVRKDVADYVAFSPQFGNKAFQSIMSAWKKIHTIYNPGTHVSNVISNVAKVHMGGLSVLEQPKYMAEAVKDLQGYGPATQFLAEKGILEKGLPTYGGMNVEGLSKQNDVLRRLAAETRPETRAALQAGGIKPMGNLEMKARDFDRWITDKYAMEDGVFRVMLFKKFTDQGMNADAASKEVMRVLPGYDTRSTALKYAQVASPFIMYPAKYIPSLLDDIAQHPARWVGLAALWGGLDQASRAQFGKVDERDLRPSQRSSKSMGYLLPGNIQVDALMRPLAEATGATPKPGEKYMFDISRFTPGSALTSSPSPASVLSAVAPGAPSVLEPGGPLMDIASRFRNVDPFTGKEWIGPGLSKGERAKKVALEGILPQITPSAISYWGQKALTRDMPNENKAAILGDIMGMLGGRPTLVTPGKEARMSAVQMERDINAVKSELRAGMRETQSPVRRAELMRNANERIQRIMAQYQESRTP